MWVKMWFHLYCRVIWNRVLTRLLIFTISSPVWYFMGVLHGVSILRLQWSKQYQRELSWRVRPSRYRSTIHFSVRVEKLCNHGKAIDEKWWSTNHCDNCGWKCKLDEYSIWLQACFVPTFYSAFGVSILGIRKLSIISFGWQQLRATIITFHWWSILAFNFKCTIHVKSINYHLLIFSAWISRWGAGWRRMAVAKSRRLARRAAKAGGGPAGGGRIAAPPHLLGGAELLLRAPQRDCLLLSSVLPPVPCLEVDMELELEFDPPGGRLGGLAPGPVGFFLKSFMSLSMLLYVLGPQTKPSGEMPMVWCLAVLLMTNRSET